MCGGAFLVIQAKYKVVNVKLGTQRFEKSYSLGTKKNESSCN